MISVWYYLNARTDWLVAKLPCWVTANPLGCVHKTWWVCQSPMKSHLRPLKHPNPCLPTKGPLATPLWPSQAP